MTNLINRKLESYFNSLWYSRFNYAHLLAPLSYVYQWVVTCRSILYRSGWFRSHKIPIPVIVVGNLTVGGSGKTPFVIALVESLKQAGFSPGVVSRGYGSKAPHYPFLVQSQSDPKHAGDEPLLIKRTANCPVVIASNRVSACHTLLEKYDCDVIISDDGLQHYALQRDIEIAIIDGQRRFGNQYCLPVGPLREPLSRIHRVHHKVATGKAQNEEWCMQLHPQALQNIKTKQTHELNALIAPKVHAVTGIGHPKRFFQTLENLGYQIIEHAFADHHVYQKNDLQFDDDFPIIMTSKDVVKCEKIADHKVWVLPIKAELPTALTDLLVNSITKHHGKNPC